MGSLQEIETLLNIEIGDKTLRPGKKNVYKNKFYYFAEMYYIVQLTQDKWMICSDNRETRQLLRNHCWFYSSRYVNAKIQYKTMAYHKAYLQYDDELVCDHINRKRFDNRFENLRITTQQQNCMNRSISTINTSGKIGVGLKEGSWYSYIKMNGRTKHGNSFSINKYGNDEAFRRAVQSRRDLEVRYGFTGE